MPDETATSYDGLIIFIVSIISATILGCIYLYSLTITPPADTLNGWMLVTHGQSGAQMEVLHDFDRRDNVIHLKGLELKEQYIEQLRTTKSLTQGEVRSLHFAARGLQDGVIYYEVSGGDTLAWQPIIIGTTWRDYEIEYPIAQSMQEGVLAFHLGEYVGDLYFDNIREKVK